MSKARVDVSPAWFPLIGGHCMVCQSGTSDKLRLWAEPLRRGEKKTAPRSRSAEEDKMSHWFTNALRIHGGDFFFFSVPLASPVCNPSSAPPVWRKPAGSPLQTEDAGATRLQSRKSPQSAAARGSGEVLCTSTEPPEAREWEMLTL